MENKSTMFWFFGEALGGSVNFGNRETVGGISLTSPLRQAQGTGTGTGTGTEMGMVFYISLGDL